MRKRVLFALIGYLGGLAIGGITGYGIGVESGIREVHRLTQERARYHRKGNALIRPGNEATVLCGSDAGVIRVRCEAQDEEAAP